MQPGQALAHPSGHNLAHLDVVVAVGICALALPRLALAGEPLGISPATVWRGGWLPGPLGAMHPAGARLWAGLGLGAGAAP